MPGRERVSVARIAPKNEMLKAKKVGFVLERLGSYCVNGS